MPRTKGRDESGSDETQGKHDSGEEVPEAIIQQQWQDLSNRERPVWLEQKWPVQSGRQAGEAHLPHMEFWAFILRKEAVKVLRE